VEAALGALREPRTIVIGLALTAIIGSGAMVRFHFSQFLDPFEDGYQNWWISANLVETGQYWDRHSMMTQGNWLPLYHFFAAGVLGLGGLRSMDALKGANIAVSALTDLTVFLVSRKRGPMIALAATGFFSFNFIDIVVSGWATAETLACFLVLVSYAMLFQGATSYSSRRIWIGSAALALAVMTRYEAWMIVSLMVIYLVFIDSQQRRRRLIALLPAMAAMAAYFAYTTQWGFLPSIVVSQTSTDIRYQLSVGSQPTPTTLLSRWWSGYLSFFPLVLLVGGVYAIRSVRRDFGAWIVLSLWVFIVGYTTLRFGNPSFRYVMITVPFLSIFGAIGVVEAFQALVRLRRESPMLSPRNTTAAASLIFVVMGATLLPSSAAFWGPGFAASGAMEPLERAGVYVSTLPLPEGKVLISESPIAAYFSGYAPDRILGSRWLSANHSEALTFLKSNAAYIVYMGVPYYRLRLLFPELQNGTSTPDFAFLFDGGGIQAGTHAVFVYRVIP